MIRRILVAAAVTTTALAGFATPANAEIDPITETLNRHLGPIIYESEFGGSALSPPSLPVPLPMVNASGATNWCYLRLDANASYEKPSWSLVIREAGSATARVTCDVNPVFVAEIRAEVTITHHCYGATPATRDTSTTSGNSPIATAAHSSQSVTAVNPGQYCGPGTAITWRFRAYARLSNGSAAAVCLNASATIGGDVTFSNSYSCL